MDTGDLIFLDPIFLPKVWGGGWLKERYGSAVPDGPVGECLVVSGRPDADCVVRGGRYDGRTLSWLWGEHPGLFGGVRSETFPLQVKLIDAHEDLSVQVHPDDDHARLDATAETKNECWYVLRPGRDRRIVIGHNARTRDELRELTEAGRWDELLRSVEMTAGDFYDIPAGTAHCILGGSIIYEVMQSSSTTYRLYDYDRLDLDGSKRELHIDQALRALAVPYSPDPAGPVVTAHGDAIETVFVDNDHFSVRIWDVHGEARFPVERPFMIASVLGGAGTVEGVSVSEGDHFIVPGTAREAMITGDVTLIVSHPAA